MISMQNKLTPNNSPLNNSEFSYITLNSNTMYEQESVLSTFDKVLRQFIDHLTQSGELVLAHSLRHLTIKQTDLSPQQSSQKILNLPVGEVYMLRNYASGYRVDGNLYIYQFKKESADTLSLVVYSSGEQKADLALTLLHSSENSYVSKHMLKLSACTESDELTRLLTKLMESTGSSAESDLIRGLKFLHAETQIKLEQHNPLLLQGKSYFVRTMYRVLYDFVHDKTTLEKCLVSFVQKTILNSRDIAKDSPYLCKRAITNLVAYFQYITWEDEQTKQANAHELIQHLNTLNLSQNFKISQEHSKLSPMILRSGVLETKQPMRNAQSCRRVTSSPHYLISDRTEVKNPLEEARHFCQILEDQRLDRSVGRRINTEYFMLRYPLPKQENEVEHAVYRSMRSEDWKQFGICLEQIGTHYLQLFDANLNKQQTPKFWVTLCTIIILRSYSHKKELADASFHPIVEILFGEMVSKVKFLPHISTYNPDFDRRWRALCLLFKSDSNRNLNQEITEIYTRILKRSDNFYAIEIQTNEDNALKGKREIKQLLEYYLNSGFGKNKFPDTDQKFIQALEVEKFFAACFKALNLASYSRTDLSYYYDLNTPLSNMQCKFSVELLNQPGFITKTKEACKPESLVSIALRKKYINSVSVSRWASPKVYDSNVIQITPHQGANDRRMVPADITLRQMLQFDLADNPMPFVLNHNFSRVNELSSIDRQYYVLEQLVHGQNLLNFLRSPGSFKQYLKHFDAFIEKGLKHFENHAHQLSQNSLFFIQLAMRVNIYIAHYGTNERLTGLLKRLDGWIKTHRNYPTLSASLHQYRLAIIISLKQLYPSDTRYFNEAFVSYGYLKIHRNSERSDTFVERIEHADLDYQFQFWLHQTFDRNVTPDLIRMLAEQIDLPIEADDLVQIESSGAIVIKRDGQPIFYFDVQLFVFLNHEKLIYSSIPEVLANHPILTYLNKTPLYCFCNVDHTIFVLVHDVDETRIEFDVNKSVGVYQSLNISGKKSSYQLIPLFTSNSVNRKFSFSENHLRLSSNTYFSEEFRCWGSLEQRIAYITHHGRIIYTLEDHMTYHDPIHSSVQYLFHTGHENNLNHFEDPRYCHIHIDPITKKGHILFVRHPELKLEIEGETIYFTHQGQRYQQILEGISPFSPAADVSHFLFKQITKPDVGLALLTVRAFRRYSYNTSKYLINCNKVGSSDVTTMVCQYDPDTGRLSPYNAVDAIYLAYVYAATYDYDKAIEVLKSISPIELSTSEAEIQVLQWLLDLSTGDEARLFSCQLKAFVLYVRCIQEKQSGNFYCKKSIEGLFEKISERYNFYIENNAYLPNIYLLKDIEINSLESFFSAQSSSLRAKKKRTLEVSLQEIYISTYDSLPSEFEANLLYEPFGNQSEDEALAHLNSDIKSEDFPKYFACYVRMTQSSNVQNKQKILNFCKIFYSYGSGSYTDQAFVGTLYRLCKQKVNLSSGIVPATILKEDVEPFSLNKLKAINSVSTLSKPTMRIAVSSEQVLLTPFLEPVIALRLFMQKEYADFYQQYQALDLAYKNALNPETTEEQYGQLKLHYLTEKLDLMQRFFSDKAARAEFLEKLDQQKQIIIKTGKGYWEQALKQANKSLVQNKYYLIQSGHYELLTEHDLMRCYAASVLSVYTEATFLTEFETIQDLHTKIHRAMLATLEFQQFHRLSEELTEGLRETKSEKIRWGKLLDLMIREHEPTLQTRSEMIHLEVTKNIMIRPDQKQMADTLMNDPCIVDSTMGSGKTTVVIPSVVNQITKGTLRVIIVLRALLKTTHSYLHTIGANTNQIPYLLDFHRNHEHTVHALQVKQQLFSNLVSQSTSEKPNYIVSAADSVQSLGLKYVELVYIKQYQEFERQIKMLEEMLWILVDNGVALIDEVHEVQDDYKSPIRYALDEPIPIPLELVQDVVGLYRFRDENPGRDVSEFVWLILNHPNSPMKNRFKQFMKNNEQFTEETVKEAITQFWINKTPLHFEMLPRFKKYLETIQTQLRLFEHVQHVYFKQQYGPSKRKDLSALERSLAIPYFSNEKPKEGSHYEDPQENITYTIESYFHEFPLDLLKELIVKWVDQAGIELQNSADEFHSFNETPSAVRFKSHFDRELDPSLLKADDATLHELLHMIKTKRDLRYDILETDVLPQIQIDCTVIESRAFDHLFAYRSASGLTATPDPANQSLPINNSASRGAREFNAALLIKHQTPVFHWDYTDIDTFLNAVYEKCPEPEKFLGLIDVGGCLKGENIDIARGLARLLQKNGSQAKYVIFYDAFDEICAVSTQDLDKIIPLGRSTDPKVISSKLGGCSVQELGIYYDQARTQGADHVNAIDCFAAVILNKENTFDQYMQGAMRLRELAERQRTMVILPTCLERLQSIEEVLNYTKLQVENALPKRILSTTAGEITSIIRRDLLNQMRKLATVAEKHAFIRSPEVKKFFVKSREAYLEAKDKTEHLRNLSPLEAHAQTSLQDWRSSVALKENVDNTVETKISEIFKRPVIYDKTSTQLFGASLETQTQVQIQVVSPELSVSFDPSLNTNGLVPWSIQNALSFRNLLQAQAGDIAADFSSNLYVSPNFVRIYKGQSDSLINPYMKPVDMVLFSMHSSDQICAYLISTDEVNDPNLIRLIDSSREHWLTTTNHMVTHGVAPNDIQDNISYQILIEQIRFFAGKFNELVEQKTPYSWLSNEPNRKFEFFEGSLKNWREADPSNFEKLKANFSRQMIVFKEMSKNPFKNYADEQFAWEEINPDITSGDIYIFQSLGRAYQQMNGDYYDYDYTAGTLFQLTQSLKSALHLPALILGYVMQHLKRLSEYKAALMTVVQPHSTDYLMRLPALEDVVAERIEEILGISIPSLLQQYEYDLESRAFSSPEQQGRFELDALGCFLTSKAFPKGAKQGFIQPMQEKLDGLSGDQQAVLFLNKTCTEYKLRYLLNALVLKPETLIALARVVEDPKTILVILKHCQGDPAIIHICLERFENHAEVLDGATQYAVASETFKDLIRVAEQQNRLFAKEWLAVLFKNTHLPVAILVDMLQDPAANDDFLAHIRAEPLVIKTLLESPNLLIDVLNTLSNNQVLSQAMQQSVIVAWVNHYAKQPVVGQLSQKYHDFYRPLLAAALLSEGDAALGFIIEDAQTQSTDLFETLVTQVIARSALVVPEAEAVPPRCMYPNGEVYRVLLAHYLEMDTESLVRMLISHSTQDLHLQQLMHSSHVETFASQLVARANQIDWLVDHAQSTDIVFQHIIGDLRFTSELALRILQRNISQETMNALLQSTSCTVDVYIAILNNPNHAAYHARVVEALIRKLPISAENLLILINHESCNNDRQFAAIIPHCSQLAQQQALAVKINTSACANQLMRHCEGNASVGEKLDINLVTEDFDDELLNKMITSSHAMPEFFVSLRTHLINVHAKLGFDTTLALLNYARNQSIDHWQIISKYTQGRNQVYLISRLLEKNLITPVVLTIIQEPEMQDPRLFNLIYETYAHIDGVSPVLRDKGMLNGKAIYFNKFHKLLIDNEFDRDNLMSILESHPFTQNDSQDPAIRSLQNCTRQLYSKSKVFLQPGKDPHNNAAQASAALYMCLRHQLLQYESNIITREQLGANLDLALNQYKGVLSQHRGYRQLIYDIAQAILCLLGVGILMTAYSYATTGNCRLFVWKNEAQRIVEEAELTIPTLGQ